MLRSPKLQKRTSDPEGPKWGFPILHPPNFWIWGHLPMGPKWGVQKTPPPCVLLRGLLPAVKAYLGVEQN